MNFIGNVIWLIYGGLIASIAGTIAGLILCVTIIGIPFGVQCFKIESFVLWPFGKEIELGQLEERKLIKQFGSAYIDYQRKVPALIPFTKK